MAPQHRVPCYIIALCTWQAGLLVFTAGTCSPDEPGPGCLCKLEELAPFGACPAGYQCAAHSELGHTSDPVQHGRNISAGICIPCSLGQYCPRGAVLPLPGSPEASQYVAKYACRPGFFCPTPRDQFPCPPGSWCGVATVKPTTCEYPVLMREQPDLTIPDVPLTVVARVYAKGDPLGGNICPPMSMTPKGPCQSGYYCPNSSAIIPCPPGHFCKWWTKEPKNCPWLAKCPAGSASADISYGGFFALFLILGLLWLAYVAFSAYIKLKQDWLWMKQGTKDKLRRLDAPLQGIMGPFSSKLALKPLLRLNQDRLRKKQGAKDKLRRLVAPLLGITGASGGKLAFKAFSTIRPRISLRFEGIGVTLRDGTVILEGVNGHFRHSKVVAIMGPSGAGKSTLLYALMGTARYGVARGRLCVNGREMRLERLRRILGYVPQDDIVHEDLTVRENLAYSAKLRCIATEDRAYLSDVVDDVIELLGLRHVQHSVVGSVEKRGVSGGQRKRVNIGLELVARPSVLFMDEPTSGLDATAATDILTALRRMADMGMNIVTVIHQPRYSVFSLFHEVLLLGKAGRTVFQGASTAALPYFICLGFQLPPNENPADFFLDVVSGCVACHANPDFQIQDLYGIWENIGSEWMGTGRSDNAVAVRDGPEAVPELSPQQLQLVQQHFDRVDREKSGFLTPEAIHAFLADVGLEATPFDMRHIMAELDPEHTGIVSRSSFISFIRYGGQHAPPPKMTKDSRTLSLEMDADSQGGTPRDTSPDMQPRGPPYDKASHPSERRPKADGDGHGSSEPQQRPQALIPPSTKFQSMHHDGSASSPQFRHSGYDEEHATGSSSRALKGLSPSHSQQLELEDALASTAYMEGPCGPPDDGLSKQPYLWQCFASCIHYWGAWAYWLLCGCWVACCCRKKSRYRAIPGTFGQFNLLVRRAGVKWVRNWGIKFLDVCLFAAAALIIGAVHGTSWELEEVRGNAVKTMLTLAAISTVASLQVFGKDRLIFWRESAAGLRTAAFFFGHQVMHLIDIFVQPAIFMSLYYTLTLPEIKFVDYYIIAVGVVWYCSGLGYMMSVMLEPQNSMVASVAIVLVLGGFFNGVEPRLRTQTPFMKNVFGTAFSRWSTEATVMQEFKQYGHYMQPRIHKMIQEIGYCGLDKESLGAGPDSASLDITDYCEGYVSWDLLMMLIQGVVLRVATFVVLRYGSTLSKFSVHRFFTLCWMLVSRTCTRWRSLRSPSWSKPASGPEAELQQTLMQGA